MKRGHACHRSNRFRALVLLYAGLALPQTTSAAGEHQSAYNIARMQAQQQEQAERLRIQQSVQAQEAERQSKERDLALERERLRMYESLEQQKLKMEACKSIYAGDREGLKACFGEALESKPSRNYLDPNALE